MEYYFYTAIIIGVIFTIHMMYRDIKRHRALTSNPINMLVMNTLLGLPMLICKFTEEIKERIID